MTSSNRRNSGFSRNSSKSRKKSGGPAGDGQVWIWGLHAAEAALANRDRKIHDIYATLNAADKLKLKEFHDYHPGQIDSLLPPGAVHQGIALKVDSLIPRPLNDLSGRDSGLVIVLDQVTDPHNAGAIFRLAAAFGATGVVMQNRKAPPLSGACAKVAVGAVETVPHSIVKNIADALADFTKKGWTVTGLAGETDLPIQDAFITDKNVIVLGAEGKGLRPRVREYCTHLARIPMYDDMESLNVATAAAIAVYEARRGKFLAGRI